MQFQDFRFDLDDNLGVVWIDFVHEDKEYDMTTRYRVDCMNKIVMILRARYYFTREFPGHKAIDMRNFTDRFLAFIEGNERRVRDLTRMLAIKKHEALAILLQEVKKAMQTASAESTAPPVSTKFEAAT